MFLKNGDWKMNKNGADGMLEAPTVQVLTISNVPSDILEAIDELAARQDRSRSSFIRRELQRIVAEYQAKDVVLGPTSRN